MLTLLTRESSTSCEEGQRGSEGPADPMVKRWVLATPANMLPKPQ